MAFVAAIQTSALASQSAAAPLSGSVDAVHPLFPLIRSSATANAPITGFSAAVAQSLQPFVGAPQAVVVAGGTARTSGHPIGG
ncbi:MAG TPA: hypothetical protein P5305_08815 [Rubrivivax sp.]|nr:hypothetical protein [Rubrivivax sp.]HRY87976.1 hypothetical protein [Rubrivivax sp.]